MYFKYIIVQSILWLLSRLPLRVLRKIGELVGWLSFKYSAKARARTKNNLLKTGNATPDQVEEMALLTAQELGKTLIEISCIAWQRDGAYCEKIVEEWVNFEQVEAVSCAGKGIIFLTPHLGNFEIGAKATASRLGKTLGVFYKPSKQKWINALMLNGRQGQHVLPIAIGKRGIHTVLTLLKTHQTVGILPDNVASEGDGVWVKFFKQDVYATTFTAKLFLNKYAPAVFFVDCIRTEKGLKVIFELFESKKSDVAGVVQDIYTRIEQVVKKYPTQYFWSYDRFRVPKHAKPKSN